MAHFKCQARDTEGKKIVSILEAETAELAAKLLIEQGCTPITIAHSSTQPDIFKQFSHQYTLKNIALNDRLLFCRQMRSLSNAGVPLSKALRSLIDSTRNTAFAETIKDIVRRLESGSSLSLALSHHHQVFDPLFIKIITVGEDSGDLGRAFAQVGQYLQQEKDIQMRLKSAFRYPVMVVSAIMVAIVIVNIYVIPAFKHVFDRVKVPLPWETRLLMSVSQFMVHYWPYILTALIVGILGFIKTINTPTGRLQWDYLCLKMPIIGDIVERSAMERFSRSLAMTLKAGVPLIHGLNIVSVAVGNSYISAKLLKMRVGIEKGETVSRMAKNALIFPPLVIQMLIVGEETGNVGDMLLEVADFYATEIDADLKNMTSVIEPFLLIVIGGMVLILALGIFLPMWNLSSAMR